MKLFPSKSRFSSKDYWESRYRDGGNSGAGSYNALAELKAEYINSLIRNENLVDAVEFGVGDGNQLSLIRYPKYLGLDVSATAIRLCSNKFRNEKNRSFMLYDGQAFSDPAGFIRADLSLSLDVLYHLVEDAVYEKYLQDLFAAARRMVLIYSTDLISVSNTSHEKTRNFTADVARIFPDWKLESEVKNKYPTAEFGDDKGSDASFFLYKPIAR